MPLPRMLFLALRGATFAASAASIYVLFIAPHGPATTWIGLGLTILAVLTMRLAGRAKARLD